MRKIGTTTPTIAVVTHEGYARDDEGWEHNAWKVVLHYKGRQMTTPYMTGLALDEPITSDVLESLLSDASSADQTFEDWCDDYGFDTDSRKAERTYQAVQAQTAKLRKLLGADYDRALEDPEGFVKRA